MNKIKKRACFVVTWQELSFILLGFSFFKRSIPQKTFFRLAGVQRLARHTFLKKTVQQIKYCLCLGGWPLSEQRRIIELIVSHERPETPTSRLRACKQVIVCSGVTRGLSQGGKNLTEIGSKKRIYVIPQKEKIFVRWCNELRLGKLL